MVPTTRWNIQTHLLGVEVCFMNNFSDVELVTQIYQLRRTGQDYQKELDELIYRTLGRIL